ncbi:CU044_2847 family protein [Kibdelosporangium philippinense]|uniref:CU044_2847 family protein n=1 Tax=Kibdelosporangium philippinense TaxID=211113 RepID=UPI003557C0CB
MTEYLSIPTETGETVLVEAADDTGRAPIGRDEQDTTTLESRLAGLRRVLVSAVSTLADIPRKPDKLTVEVGAKFVAGAGVVIAKTSAEASIKVVVEWNGTRTASKPDDTAATDHETNAT